MNYGSMKNSKHKQKLKVKLFKTHDEALRFELKLWNLLSLVKEALTDITIYVVKIKFGRIIKFIPRIFIPQIDPYLKEDKEL